MKYTKEYIESVHQYSSNHQKELNEYNLCGCFYCCQTYPTNEIKEWIEDQNDNTAICPKCGIDSVLSEKHPISDSEFMDQMNTYWF